MKRIAMYAGLFSLFAFGHLAGSEASALLRHIDFSVENISGSSFSGVVWIDAAPIVRLVPGFDGSNFIVTTTYSPDLSTDLRKLRAFEVPSQLLDANGGGSKAIGLSLSLQPHEMRVVTVHIGPLDRITRLRAVYRKSCGALLTGDGHGIYWESDRVAYGYDPARQAVRIFGKLASRNSLDLISSSMNDYNSQVLVKELNLPQSIPAFGTVQILPEPAPDHTSAVTTVAAICAAGPLTACVRISSFRSNNSQLNTQYSISRNSRWTWVDVELPRISRGAVIVTGVPKRKGEKVVREDNIVATFADSSGLGLAVYCATRYFSGTKETATHHLIILKPDEQHHVKYAIGAFWALEQHENVIEQGEVDGPLPHVPSMERYGTTGRVLLRPGNMDTVQAFENRLHGDLTSMVETFPVVRLLSRDATTYTAIIPSDAGRPHRNKGYGEALQLLTGRLRSVVERQGGRVWFSSDPDGRPTYLEAKESWGSGYLVSMLWDAYHFTNDPEFRNWALEVNHRMLGDETIQKHVTGLNFWDASVRTYRETHEQIWHDSALRAADMLLQIADPKTGFIPELGPALRDEPSNPYAEDNYIKVDAVSALPILWWAFEETQNRKYWNAANRHLDAAIANLIERDGSVLQMLWFDPKTGEVLGIATSQGYGGNSRWTRGLAWVLDALPDAYVATKNPRYLDTFRRSARYLIQNVPEDLVPWTDFDDQAVGWRYRDTSAAALCAYGLLRMSELDPDRELAREDREFGIRIINSLIDRYLTPVGDDSRPKGMLSNASYIKDVSGEFIWGNFGLMRSLVWLREKGIDRENLN